MKFFTVKPEYLTLWGEDCTEDTVITEAELSRLSQEWDKPVEDLMEQLDVADFGTAYDYITDKCRTKNGSGHWCWSWQMLTDEDVKFILEECPDWSWVDEGVFRLAKQRGLFPDDFPFVVNADGDVVDYDAAVMHMDDEIRETLHNGMAPCSNQAFFTAYEAAHLAKYGEAFQV